MPIHGAFPQSLLAVSNGRQSVTAPELAFGLIALGPLLQITPVPSLLGLGGAWWAVKTYRPLAERYNAPYALIPVMQSNVVAHLATGLLLVAGYLVSAAL